MRLCFRCFSIQIVKFWQSYARSVHTEQIVAYYEYFIEFYIFTAGFLVLNILSVFISSNRQETCSYLYTYKYATATFLLNFFLFLPTNALFAIINVEITSANSLCLKLIQVFNKLRRKNNKN